MSNNDKGAVFAESAAGFTINPVPEHADLRRPLCPGAYTSEGDVLDVHGILQRALPQDEPMAPLQQQHQQQQVKSQDVSYLESRIELHQFGAVTSSSSPRVSKLSSTLTPQHGNYLFWGVFAFRIAVAKNHGLVSRCDIEILRILTTKLERRFDMAVGGRLFFQAKECPNNIEKRTAADIKTSRAALSGSILDAARKDSGLLRNLLQECVPLVLDTSLAGDSVEPAERELAAVLDERIAIACMHLGGSFKGMDGGKPVFMEKAVPLDADLGADAFFTSYLNMSKGSAGHHLLP
eukprot:4604709-Amphidinium_carterae.1